MCTHGECILRCANMCTCHHAAARERRDVSGSTTFHLALLRQSLSLTQELARRPASHRRPPVSAPTVLGYRRFFFYVGVGYLNPAPQTCEANTQLLSHLSNLAHHVPMAHYLSFKRPGINKSPQDHGTVTMHIVACSGREAHVAKY